MPPITPLLRGGVGNRIEIRLPIFPQYLRFLVGANDVMIHKTLVFFTQIILSADAGENAGPLAFSSFHVDFDLDGENVSLPLEGNAT